MTKDREIKTQITTLMQIKRCLVYLEINDQHLSSGLLVGPMAERIWDWFVVLLDWGKAIIV